MIYSWQSALQLSIQGGKQVVASPLINLPWFTLSCSEQWPILGQQTHMDGHMDSTAAEMPKGQWQAVAKTAPSPRLITNWISPDRSSASAHNTAHPYGQICGHSYIYAEFCEEFGTINFKWLRLRPINRIWFRSKHYVARVHIHI